VAGLAPRLPWAGDLRKLIAEVALRKPDPDRAVALANAAVAGRAPDYRDQLWLAQVLGQVPGHEAETERALRRAVDLADSVPQTWLGLVRHLARVGETAKAEAAVEEARRRARGEQAALTLALCHEALGRNDRAEELLRGASAARPDVPTLSELA